MMTAYRRAMANKGAPGIDKMTAEQLQPSLVEHGPHIKEELLTDRYQPAAVRAALHPLAPMQTTANMEAENDGARTR